MTEFLSRAEGSFGIQAHCTLEPGVVVIASKGQPMSLAYDPCRPIVLFGSEVRNDNDEYVRRLLLLESVVDRRRQWLFLLILTDSGSRSE